MIGYGPIYGGWPWFGLASFVLFWGLIIVAVIFLIRYLSRRGSRPGGFGAPFWQPGPPPYMPPGMGAAEQILAERFARGEIDEQEYRRRLAALRGAYPGPHAPTPQGTAPAGPAPGAAAPGGQETSAESPPPPPAPPAAP